MGEFGIGQPVRRKEDTRLLTGRGQFTDDINLDGQAHAAFLRSPHANAKIVAIDASATLNMPGVIAVYTGGDLADAGMGVLVNEAAYVNRDGSPMHKPPRSILPVGQTRFVGEVLARLADPHAAVRQHAIRVSERVLAESAQLRDKLYSLVADEDLVQRAEPLAIVQLGLNHRPRLFGAGAAQAGEGLGHQGARAAGGKAKQVDPGEMLDQTRVDTHGLTPVAIEIPSDQNPNSNCILPVSTFS